MVLRRPLTFSWCQERADPVSVRYIKVHCYEYIAQQSVLPLLSGLGQMPSTWCTPHIPRCLPFSASVLPLPGLSA